MTKQELIDQGFKYIATQNCKTKTEVWARFSGWEDTVQYYYYFPDEDITSPTIMTITYVGQLDMFAQMRDKMRSEFFKQDVQYDKTNIWTDESNK